MFRQRLIAPIPLKPPGRIRKPGWYILCAAAFVVVLVGVLTTPGLRAQDASVPLPANSTPPSQLPDNREPQSGAGPDAQPEKTGGVSAAPVQYIGPDTYILLDENGRPQHMPGMSYEDFMAAWKQSQQVDQSSRRPRYVLENVECVGQAGQEHVELRCEITVRLLTDEPVDVALGMMEAILQSEARFSERTADQEAAAGEQSARSELDNGEYLDFDPRRGGFVARVAGRANEQRTVSLTVLVPLQRDASGNTLSLTYPRHVVKTYFEYSSIRGRCERNERRIAQPRSNARRHAAGHR